jgi:DNA-binding PadR family transcriptional regulator
VPRKRTPAPAEITTTSAAILGLLAVQEGTAYELARRMETNHRFIWPRAASKLYEEVKRLVALGLVDAEAGATGKRPHVRYRIRAEGLRALRAWTPKPSAPPSLSFEALVKLAYADFGSIDDARAQVLAIRAQAEESIALGKKLARMYQDEAVALPERMHTNAIVWRFLAGYFVAMRDWSIEAERALDAWDGVAPSKKNRDATRRVFEEGLRLLEKRPKP